MRIGEGQRPQFIMFCPEHNHGHGCEEARLQSVDPPHALFTDNRRYHSEDFHRGASR